MHTDDFTLGIVVAVAVVLVSAASSARTSNSTFPAGLLARRGLAPVAPALRCDRRGLACCGRSLREEASGLRLLWLRPLWVTSSAPSPRPSPMPSCGSAIRGMGAIRIDGRDDGDLPPPPPPLLVLMLGTPSGAGDGVGVGAGEDGALSGGNKSRSPPPSLSTQRPTCCDTSGHAGAGLGVGAGDDVSDLLPSPPAVGGRDIGGKPAAREGLGVRPSAPTTAPGRPRAEGARVDCPPRVAIQAVRALATPRRADGCACGRGRTEGLRRLGIEG